MEDEPSRYQVGMQIRRRILGEEHVNSVTAKTTDIDRVFQEWITEMAWGAVWARESLDERTRSLVTIAILAALGRDELDLHLLASRNTGALPSEIVEVLLHVGIYAGIPAANDAVGRVKEILGDEK